MLRALSKLRGRRKSIWYGRKSCGTENLAGAQEGEYLYSFFYLLDAEVCKKIATAEHEQILNASVIWDEESLRETGVNRMDLAGFLLDLAALCNAAQAKNADVYALLSKQ